MPANAPTLLQSAGNYRWRICALLFFATTINYVDRNVLSFTMIDEFFRKEMLDLPADAVLTDADIARFKEMMGYVDAAFKTAYALGFLIIGYVIDRLGTKTGFSIALSVWSLAGVLNGFVGSVRGLSLTRFMLGLGESGNFPSAVKTVAEWFPKKERSLAAGVFNAGANIGIILTALAVPYITIHYGWRTSFIATGLLGFVVLIFWRIMYSKPEEHSSVTKAELQYIQQDGIDTRQEKVTWGQLFKHRQTWAFAAGKFMADPIWYFYLTWLPDFFNSSEALDQKLDLKQIGIPFLVIYLVSDAGSVFFGWLSSRLIQAGWSVNKARKTAMLLCALCVAPIVFASVTHNIYVAIALIALAAAAHQGWSANMYTLASDMFPKQSVGSVVGIGSMFGAISGIAFAASTGIIRVKFGYVPLFVIAGSAYLIGLLIIHLLAPRLEPVEQ
ncbi:MAG TPA: MFS transporter [Chitinophagales bacterium]|nr:MFS transporter [Chitinophagales bacterium]